MKFYSSALLIFMSSYCLASGYVDIIGKTPQGQQIIVTGGEAPEINGKDPWIIDGYKNEYCFYNDSYTKFFCEKGGKSPLAGASYRLKDDHKKCGGIFFILEPGTGGSSAPKRMYQEPWEC